MNLTARFLAVVALPLVLAALPPQEASPGWLQDDLPAAREQARREGKPLLVVFR